MWKRLFATLKAKGYSGGEDDLDAIKAFMAEKGLEFSGSDGKTIDVDVAYKGRTSTIVIEDDEEDEVETAKKSEDGEDAATKELKALKAEVEKLKAAPHVARTTKGFEAPTGGYRPETARIRAENAAYNAKSFGTGRHDRKFADADQARAFKGWFVTELLPRAATAEDREWHAKTQTTTVNTAGGATIPDEFIPQLIDLKEKYGVARGLVGVTLMSNDVLIFPRRTGGLTVYAPGEAGTITASDVAFDNITVTAKKLATVTQISAELLNDSALSMANVVAGEIAFAFANKEDDCFFNGDGTSTYFGWTGVRNLLASATASLVTASGNLFSEYTVGDFTSCVGLLPTFADTPAAKWVMHKATDGATALRLQQTAGGQTGQMISAGGVERSLLNYGVVHAQVLPKTDSNSQIAHLLGDFSKGAKFGEVRGSMQIATSDQLGFLSDTIYIRGTERIAMVVHDVGDTSNAGPIVGIVSAGS